MELKVGPLLIEAIACQSLECLERVTTQLQLRYENLIRLVTGSFHTLNASQSESESICQQESVRQFASQVKFTNQVESNKAERLLAEAAGYGAQLVVFPEAFVGGYPRGSNFGVVIGNRTAKGKTTFSLLYCSVEN
ncbi:unnamed protein product [Malus baccata var. baccata]